MRYIHVKNLEKYNPGYTDRTLIWCKIYFTMLNSNYDFELIDDIDKWRLIAFIMLEIQMKKPIPYNEKWLLKKISNNKRSIAKTIAELHNFVEVVEEEDNSVISDEETDAIGNIYFIQAGDSIKIGYTKKDVKYRLQKLQTGNPNSIKLLKKIKGTLKDEKRFHDMFSKYRVKNEWYRAEESLLIDISNVTSIFNTCNKTVTKSRVDKSRVDKSRVDKPPAELSKKTTSKDQPFKEPTTEQKQTLAKLHHTLSKPPYKFNIYNYISHVNKKLGYFPPIDSMINIANTAIKNKKDKLWGYFNNALKEEFPKRFADLNEKQGKNYKNEPANMPQRLKDIFNK
jgi:hypothetical protein